MGQSSRVVFVCEHGSAKSVVAAAHFNRLAGERGLDLRAMARGTSPDAEIAPNAARGLEADGLAAAEAPTQLSSVDLAEALRVVAFGPLPETYRMPAALEVWDDIPPVSEGYATARDRMLERLERLVGEIGAGG